MRHQLHTEISIDAPTQAVWDLLTDLDRYSEWNPFIVSAEGKVEVGQRLTNRLQPPGGKAITFRPTVTAVEPEETFEWLGRLGLPGIFDARHRFELEPTPNGATVLTHGEDFSGVLVRFMRRSLDARTKQGFEEMNKALKAAAEANATSGS